MSKTVLSESTPHQIARHVFLLLVIALLAPLSAQAAAPTCAPQIATGSGTPAGAGPVSMTEAHALAIKTDCTLWAWGGNSYGQLGDGSTTSSLTAKQIGIDFVIVAATSNTSVALKRDGTLFGWGSWPYNSPTPIQIGTGFTAISAGVSHFLALKGNGSLWAWGSNWSGQLGNGTQIDSPTPIQIGTGFTSVAAGLGFSVAIKSDGTMWGWGNASGGLTFIPNSLTPVQIASGFTKVVANNHILALKGDGSLWAWGPNYAGQLGDGTRIDRTSPVQIGSGFASIAVSISDSAAIKLDGTLWMWGAFFGVTPTLISKNIARIAMDFNDYLIMKSNRRLWGWGNNASGVHGDGTTAFHISPIPALSLDIDSDSDGIPNGEDAFPLDAAASIDADGDRFPDQWNSGKSAADSTAGLRLDAFPEDPAASLDSDGDGFPNRWNTGKTAADSPRGLLDLYPGNALRAGDHDHDGADSLIDLFPTDPLRVQTQPSIAAAQDHSLALSGDGKLWQWGKLGVNWNMWPSPPTPKPSDLTPRQLGIGFVKIAAGYMHNLALKGDGSLWVWGDNQFGQLGDGVGFVFHAGIDVANYLSPEYVAAPKRIGNGFADIAANGYGSLALKRDGTLWAWGIFKGLFSPATGNTHIDAAHPIQIGSGFIAIAAGGVNADEGHFLAVKNDGTLWAMGNNNFGQLGDGTTTNSPTLIQIGSGFASVIAGWGHSFAFKTDGTLWAWGNNAFGELGDGTTTNRLRPTLIGNGFVEVSSGGVNTLALKSDGSLWTWGNNYYYSVNSLTPVQIGSGYSSIYAGSTGHSLAIKEDGSLWAWGSNDYGQVGDGTTTFVAAPKQIMASGFILDTDGDGVADRMDAFRTDPAASIDSDGDGYPDSWNTRKTAASSTTGLKLDGYPKDRLRSGIDSDGDGLDDAWEMANYGNLTTASAATVASGGLLDLAANQYALAPTASYSSILLNVTAVDATGGGQRSSLAKLSWDLVAQTLRAQAVDASNGAAMGNAVDFDPAYVVAGYLALDDLNGNGRSELALMGKHAVSGVIGVQIKDTSSGALISHSTLFGSTFRPLAMRSTPDINGDGHADLAVLAVDTTGSVQVALLDPLAGMALSMLNFGNGATATDLIAVADFSGNGKPDVGVLLRNQSSGAIGVQWIDVASALPVAQLQLFGTAPATALLSLPDINGNGRAEVVSIGSNNLGNTLIAIHDSYSSTLLGKLGSASTYAPIDYAIVPDSNGNLAGEIAMLAINVGSGVPNLLVKDSSTGTILAAVPIALNNVSKLVIASDLNGNGSTDIGILGVDPTTGSQRLLFVDIVSKKTLASIAM